ncbi:photosystem II manganese-stabilizing polypeptide [Dactylococcopsis salina]|uniref:Photosystem II extrinsic protein O n=1 Tax=Dactylococcopsis salina (strain PCC 8305) TaxID=13035 RepID=K9YWL3_DACS8|nr:photosystem II manganese-stabilizing polypeptide [Dactylococcopsis salina]AFZ51311.1 Manganese-stabilising protein / photosystem II polypeptide [Dactylococcopsis salina PCC 8305]
MKYRSIIATILALCLGVLTACAEEPSEYVDKSQLTYDQVLGTGLANKCPRLASSRRGTIEIDTNTIYKIKDICLQPTDFFVKEEPTNRRREAEFVPGKLLTRSTSSLDQIIANLKLNEEGQFLFEEIDGIDFQPITVQLPGGEQIPFLFTIKGLAAQTEPGLDNINTSTDLEGDFRVPSYRGALFLDPKGRGVASGYDNAIALPAQADDDELERANVKRYTEGKGHISLQIEKVDQVTGEIAGTFDSEQPSDTDLGAQEPEEVKVRGIFYGRIENATS